MTKNGSFKPGNEAAKGAGAPAGNSNARRGTAWRNALQDTLERFTSGGEDPIKAGQALNRIARKVVELALAGDKDAYTEIANRLDGKAPQALEHSGLDGTPLHVFEKRFVEPDNIDRSTDSPSPRTAH